VYELYEKALTMRNSIDFNGLILGAYGERVEAPGTLTEALRRALDNVPAVLDVVTSQLAVSSDAKKGLGYIPDYQPLTAWDDAERRRRSLGGQ
jgi:acetolactate synthase I/II/III large subunit